MNIPPPSKVAASPITLPEELIGEVLSYLTVKSLMRMKCVCMSWNTLISDPIFVKLHLMHSPRITHLVLNHICSFLCWADIIPISMSDWLKSWQRTITITPTDDPYRRIHSNYIWSIVGSCNGLICMRDRNHYMKDYIEHSLCFWNPATRTKSEKLGSICTNRNLHIFIDVKFTFGYDNSTDTYKVVVLNLEREENRVRTVVKVFTLGENVWRDINCFPVVLVDCYLHDGVYFGNSINWLVYHQYNCHLKNLTIKKYVIVSFDLGTETYSQLLLPPYCNNETPLHLTPTLFVFMDCLCLSCDFEKTYFVIWQMKEFGVEESWTQFLKISYLDLNISITELEYSMQLIPLCFSNGDALIFANNFERGSTLYDWRNNRVKTIESINSVQWYNAKVYNVESLVSTC